MAAPRPIAQVVVNVRTRPDATTYDYAVPAGLDLQVGHLVWVPFGSRRVQGIVFGLVDHSEHAGAPLRPVEALVAPEPALRPHQVPLARWIADYYCAPLLDAALLMLPPAMRQRSRVVVSLAPLPLLPDLDPDERRVVDYLVRHGAVDEERLRIGLRGVAGLPGLLDRLQRRGAISRVAEVMPPAARPRVELYVRLPHQANIAAARRLAERAPARRRALDALAALLETAGRLSGPGAGRDLLVPAADLRREADVSLAVLRDLAATGLIALEEREVRRDPAAGRAALPPLPVALTEEQTTAAEAIEATIGVGDAFLLHGVTGSGKTEVYLRAIRRALDLGRSAFVLVPEIALEPQVAERLAAHFPGLVALVHSGLRAGERFDEWRRIRDGQARVVVGARSALFAPLGDPGLIVLDEAHEWTYKQEDPAPRYHAREVAHELARLTGATLVLGSATPDVETYARARAGAYRLLELRQRVRAPARTGEGTPALRLVHPPQAAVVPEPAPLPPVEVVDMRLEAAAGVHGAFSRPLAEALRLTVERREQAILFLNRRGTATFVQCQGCGHVLVCPRCDVALVYHGEREELRCHQCGHHARVPHRCPVCRRADLGFHGVGTQRVEAEARALLPAARVLRWDRDSVGASRTAPAELLGLFARGEADVLVGTQLVAKGLDLPRVTLVGVVSADTALFLPDFRAAERTFQLIEQVAGRAGRSTRPGRVILQTFSPDHYAIRAAAAHDFVGFFEAELAFRRRHGYPPAGQLIRLLFSHSNEERCRAAAAAEVARLEAGIARLGLPDVEVLGPAPAFRRRIGGVFRRQIILRGADLRPVVRDVGLPREARPPRSPAAPTFGWTIDVDPVSLL